MLRRKNSSPVIVTTIPLDSCLAKTRYGENGKIPGRTVEEHCRIAGAVARRLLEGYYSKIACLFPLNAWIAALLHDIGKVSPTFQKKIYEAVKVCLPDLASVNVKNEKNWGGHPAVSFATLFDLTDDKGFARIAGYHHGRNFVVQRPHFHGFGGEPWEKLRKELASKLTENVSMPKIDNFMQEILVLGLVVLADWIASSEIFDNPEEAWEALVPEAIHKAGFILPKIRKGLAFEDIFPFAPNEIQKKFMNEIKGPGIYILEAPMGMGKTEAALAAAYKLLESGQASGVYFGLPTQLTSNMIYERVNAFLDKILEEETAPILVHGNARLKKYMDQQLGKDAAPGGSWFDENRRGLLAPFAVGTLDQALLSVMHVRHAALRALGLAGKVVILDEVHSYDAYTGELLDVLVERLGKFGCTVIILSATLTNERRQKLIGKIDNESCAYPLLSLFPDGADAKSVPVQGPVSKNVRLHFESNDAKALEEALLRAENGEQVLWIENTVAMAQEIFRFLGSRAVAMGLECGLLHSRFTPNDRANNEKYWTDIYGKYSPMRSKGGRILVGTQVLEQSLDLDADFLITRLCPTDMLLQRMGRLWRHPRADRAHGAQNEAWILSPDLETVLKDPQMALKESGTSIIYAPYILGRSLEVWNGLETVSLPDDIRYLLEKTYLSRKEEPSSKMEVAAKALKDKREAKRNLALAGVASIGKPLDDEGPGTRLVEENMVKLLLLRDLNLEKGECLLPDGSKCQLEPIPSIRKDRFAIASSLAMSVVRIPGWMAPDKLRPEYLRAFAPYIFEAKVWQTDNKFSGGELRIALLSEGQRLHDIFGNPLMDSHYSQKLGFFQENIG